MFIAPTSSWERSLSNVYTCMQAFNECATHVHITKLRGTPNKHIHFGTCADIVRNIVEHPLHIEFL